MKYYDNIIREIQETNILNVCLLNKNMNETVAQNRTPRKMHYTKTRKYQLTKERIGQRVVWIGFE